MERNKKDMLYSLGVAVTLLGLCVICWLKPANDFSATERRKLEQLPELSLETVMNGSFMSDFESYTVDQFPFRDGFRGIKALVQKYMLGQSDNNGIYMAEGHLSQMDETLSEDALSRAVNKLNQVYENHIKGSDAKVYLSIIPDKNYFLAKENGYLAYDYDELYSYVQDGLKYMHYIEIEDLLSLEDYYRTDSHWKQQNILDVAERLKGQMQNDLMEEAATHENIDGMQYEAITLNNPFFGVYYGQAALPVEPDVITYMEHEGFDSCRVYDHENQREIPIYDLELAAGRDGYEMFLSGALSVISIENPKATTDKELVIFRDSYGSSIAPLLVEHYSKITLIDIRYINEKMIGEFVEFTNQDVLFLYSTSVLNNEVSFR